MHRPEVNYVTDKLSLQTWFTDTSYKYSCEDEHQVVPVGLLNILPKINAMKTDNKWQYSVVLSSWWFNLFNYCIKINNINV